MMSETEQNQLGVLTSKVEGMSTQFETLNEKLDRFMEGHTAQRVDSIREFSDVKNTVGFICKMSAWGGGLLAVVLAALIVNFVQDKKTGDFSPHANLIVERIEKLEHSTTGSILERLDKLEIPR